MCQKITSKTFHCQPSLPLDLQALFKEYCVPSTQGSKGWGEGQGLIWFDKAIDFFSLLEDSQKYCKEWPWLFYFLTEILKGDTLPSNASTFRAYASYKELCNKSHD